MKIRDDKGKHEIIDVYGISYVSMVSKKTYDHKRGRLKRKGTKKTFVTIEFNGHDFGLTLQYKSKAQAKAAYAKVIKRAEEERY